MNDAAFISGADFSRFGKSRSSQEANEAYDRTGERAMSRLTACESPRSAPGFGAPAVGLEAYTRKYCGTIADNAPLTTHTLKRTVGELAKGSDADLVECNSMVAACFDSQDFIEGRRAFMGKRRPAFWGI